MHRGAAGQSGCGGQAACLTRLSGCQPADSPRKPRVGRDSVADCHPFSSAVAGSRLDVAGSRGEMSS
jgi:hypothetical protein